MKENCNVVLDLIPLVKDNVASVESIELVMAHVRDCKECSKELEGYSTGKGRPSNDNKVIYKIKKHLFIISTVILSIGALLGMSLNKNSSSNLLPVLIALGSILVVGVMLFKKDNRGDDGLRKFFMGRAIGTIVLFSILGLYLLFKYIFF